MMIKRQLWVHQGSARKLATPGVSTPSGLTRSLQKVDAREVLAGSGRTTQP
jgi:hypothetical protein